MKSLLIHMDINDTIPEANIIEKFKQWPFQKKEMAGIGSKSSKENR